MKRHGYLIEKIADPENIRIAFWKAARRKNYKSEVIHFRCEFEKNILKLSDEILRNEVKLGLQRFFTVYEPKARKICVTGFRDRVLHHSILNVCEPYFERRQIFDSYACRKNKGNLNAVKRLRDVFKKYEWFCKLDIKKYFDSVDHFVLYSLLRRIFKDVRLLQLLGSIISSYQALPGRGLPIGYLTSQHFGNFYLSGLDHFIKEKLRQKGYVRYMDDMVMAGNSKKILKERFLQVKSYVESELGLRVKENVLFGKCQNGCNFLGYRIFKNRIRLSRRSKIRFKKKYKKYMYLYESGIWSEQKLQSHIEPLFAFVMHVDSAGFRKKIIFGA